MASEPRRSFSAREIILEAFPGTDPTLIPAEGDHGTLYWCDSDGRVVLEDLGSRPRRVTLEPLPDQREAGHPVICEACHRHLHRFDARIVKAAVPGSRDRRFRYATLCADTKSCDRHRVGDRSVRELLRRFLEG